MNTASLFEKTGLAVGTGATLIHTLTPGGHARRVNYEIHNTGPNPLTHVSVQVLQHPNGSLVTLLSDTDFSVPSNGVLVWCSATTPNTLAAGAFAQFAIDVAAAYQIQIFATAGTATTVDVRGGEQQG